MCPCPDGWESRKAASSCVGTHTTGEMTSNDIRLGLPSCLYRSSTPTRYVTEYTCPYASTPHEGRESGILAFLTTKFSVGLVTADARIMIYIIKLSHWYDKFS